MLPRDDLKQTDRNRVACARGPVCIPLYLDLPAIGIVHACWCEQSFADLESTLAPGQRLSPESIEQYSHQGSAVYEAIERILKGPEQQLPDALRFKDKDGHLRSHARLIPTALDSDLRPLA